nr:hypothetical protein [Tanacetum cinerariifolium]
MRDEHLDIIPAMKSDEFIKSSVENLASNPSESEGECECDLPACENFTTLSNILFDAEYDFYSSDDQSFSDEDFPKEIVENLVLNPSESEGENGCDVPAYFATFSNILFDADYDFYSVDDQSLYDEDEDIRLTKRLLYDNSSPCLSREFISENSNAEIESFSPSPILVEDNDSLMEEIDLSFTPDDPMPSGIKEDDYDSKRDILILKDLLDNYSLSLPKNESFHFDIPSSS